MTIATKPLVGSLSNECLVCEQSDDVEYWDTGRYLDLPYPDKHEGRKFLCRNCVNDAAKEFGFLKPEDVTVLQDRNTYLEDQQVYNNNVDKLVEAVKEASDRIAAGYPGLAAVAPGVVEQSVPNTKATKDSKIVNTTTPEDTTTN